MPKGFLIALILIVLVECANIYFDDYFYSPERKFGGLRRKVKNNISQSVENSFDILILGDSHSHTGLIPKIIEDRTGLTCFNFGLSSNQKIIGYSFLFEKYLSSHTEKPKYALFSFIPFITYPVTKDSFSEKALSHLADLKSGNKIKFMKEFGLGLGVKFMIPSIKHQGRIREFFSSYSTFVLPTKEQIDHVTDKVYEDNGHYPIWQWITAPRTEHGRINEFERFFKEVYLDEFRISPFSYRYFINILDLAKENNVTLLLYIPAMPPYVAERIKGYAYMRQYLEFIESLKDDYPNLIVIEAQHVLDSDDMFLDIYHSSETGAILLSEFISKEINEIEKKRLNGGGVQ